MYNIGFVIEQVLGHITYTKNLQTIVAQDQSLCAAWGLPQWECPGALGRLKNWTLRAGLQTRKLVADMHRYQRLDALFFHTQVMATLAPDWLLRVPSVISFDATPKQIDRLSRFYDHSPGSGWLEKIKWHKDCITYQSAAHLVTWSQWARQGLVDEYKMVPEKITVIPPGIAVKAWDTERLQKDPGTPVRILFVGGDFERKGGQLLLQAFRRIRAERSQTDLQDKTLELHLVTHAHLMDEPGVRIYRDMQPNSSRLRKLYRDCDIFCLPTNADSLGIALAEAGAAGLPLIATNMAAIPEIVQLDKSGILIPPGDLDALCEALQLLTTRPELRIQYGMEARKVVFTNYDANRNAGRLLDLLKDVADRA